MSAALEGRDLTIGYGSRTIISDLSLLLEPGSVTALVGPNGCGKSTLLNTFARLLKPGGGSVVLDGKDIAGLPTKTLARNLAYLPQSVSVPPGVTVRELVGYGRYPHQGLTGSVSSDDIEAIEWAMEVTATTAYADRMADTLSGGERQRAWIAMALAQQTGVLLLDEPTTFLDIRHQLGTLSLVRKLNREHGLTVGMVLHELNQAATYSDYMVMMHGGTVVARGRPAEVMTPEAITAVFGVDVTIVRDPRGGLPICLPYEPPPQVDLAAGNGHLLRPDTARTDERLEA